MALADIREAIDGRRYTLDGIDGTIRVEGSFPYTRVMHYASPKGRKSPQYLATKRYLRDDWDTDLTDSERLVSVFYALLGTAEAERLCALPGRPREGRSASFGA